MRWILGRSEYTDMIEKKEYRFPFHYGQEADSYTFYRVPKILFTEEIFDHLSTDAKLLYGILLDRMQLSVRNRWIDGDGKIYIYYPREKIMDALTCGNKKAGQLLAELDDRHGIGLITRIHQGLGKPDKIYVHKCNLSVMPRISRSNTKEEKTEQTEADPVLPDPEDETVEDGDGQAEKDAMEKYYAYRDHFEKECHMDELRKSNPYYTEVLDEMEELLTEICCSKKPLLLIGKEERPAGLVRARFMKLRSGHIQYVLNCFTENTTRVRNIRQYLLTALYNAPATISSYYTALVHHDMYGEKQEERRESQ